MPSLVNQNYKISNTLSKQLILMCVLLFSVSLAAQDSSKFAPRKELKLRLNESGSHYLKATILSQIWLRYNENNPGSTLYGYPKETTFDIGIRRLRFQLYGQLSDKVFFYTQFGQNNFNVNSPRFTGAFFHDALIEYKIREEYFSLGAGLNAWSGYLRFASAATASILGLDAPLYQQATNSTSDQFLRKLGIYAKGKVAKLDYRVALSTPMAVQNSVPTIPPLSGASDFSLKPPKLQYQGYLKYEFLDAESNLTPYHAGTYLGAKRILSLGAGLIHQADAMWHLNSASDTVSTALNLVGVDVFYDRPLNVEKGTALSVYLAYSNTDLGPNYLRNNNAMNPANGVNASASQSGAGNAFAMIGTGTTLYAQLAYKAKNNLLANKGSLMPYASVQHNRFKAVKTPLSIYELGLSWLINGGHNAKLSLGVQNRPIVNLVNGEQAVSSTKNQVILQYQVAF